MAFTYPRNVLDEPADLLGLLGSFWSKTYDGQFFVGRYAYGRGQLEAQTFLDTLEAVATVSRFQCPVLHRRNWQALTIRESDKDTSAASILRYGERAAAIFDAGGPYQFGVPHTDAAFGFIYPIPGNIAAAQVIFNRITSPSLTLTENLDYIVDVPNSRIIFRNDPFADDRVAVQDIFTGNEVTDREAVLWVFRGGLEADLVYMHVANLVSRDNDTRQASSQAYLDAANAVLDNFVEGSSRGRFEALLAAVTDTPAADGDETVQVVTKDASHRLVITDKRAYRFHLDAEPVVAVGDTLRAGQPLVDVWQIYEFNRGEAPTGIGALTLGKGFIPASYVGELTFENKTVDWVVETVDGRTKMSFEIGGFPGDVTAFWNEVHNKGLASGTTLAQLLDQRPEPRTGDPTAGGLPATVNPLEFLAQNVLRQHAFLITIKATSAGYNRLSLTQLRLLRKIIPPHTSVLILVELAVTDEPVSMDAEGTTTSPGADDSVTAYLGLEPRTDEVSLDRDPYFAAESIRVYQSAGRCV